MSVSIFTRVCILGGHLCPGAAEIIPVPQWGYLYLPEMGNAATSLLPSSLHIWASQPYFSSHSSSLFASGIGWGGFGSESQKEKHHQPEHLMPTNFTVWTVDIGKVKGRNRSLIFMGLSVPSHRSRLECCSSEGGQAETAAHMVSPATRCCRAVRYGSTRALPRRKYQLWALAGSGTFYSEPQHYLN